MKLSEKARAMGMDVSRIRRALGTDVNVHVQSDLAESTDAWNSLIIHAAAYDHPGKIVHVREVGGWYPSDPTGYVEVDSRSVSGDR